MQKEKPTTKICKHCKTEISYEARICPQCRKKQGMSLVLKIIIVVLVIFALGSCVEVEDDTSTSDTNNQETQDNQDNQESEDVIQYRQVSVIEMIDMLDKNAAKASKEFKGQYLEITGTLKNIDSDLSYISVDSGADFELIDVMCYIKNEEQENKILEMEIGDEITIQGKCTDVGEVLGYYLDIDNIK